ncbi:hypothetical protein PRUPE_1G419100 [Prunus persica]|uniref:Uncharacterized protein n=1 Tax=Prunus persica TaxID=3760 RepID=A0A251RC69_PRUPE|nr:hypothetical protein PRUPE_1G419100 [Prunus persica]
MYNLLARVKLVGNGRIINSNNGESVTGGLSNYILSFRCEICGFYGSIITLYIESETWQLLVRTPHYSLFASHSTSSSSICHGKWPPWLAKHVSPSKSSPDRR